MGLAMWQRIGVLAELERSLIIERTRAGVKAAQGRGVKFGRKSKLTAQQIGHARKLIAFCVDCAFFARNVLFAEPLEAA
jgi:DNA invertase Pin-like site-specific DNA recombinase